MARLNTETKNQTKAWALLGRWFGVFLLAYTIVEIFFLPHSHIPVKAYLITLGGAIILTGHILYPEKALTIVRPDLRTAVWSILLAGGTFLLLMLQLGLQLHHYPDMWQLIRLSIGVCILTLALCSVTRMARLFMQDAGSAVSATLLLMIILTTIPLWLSTSTEYLFVSEAATNTIISVSPLTYLAVLTDYDYLRSSWFYSHTPFGELRYTYPSALLLTVFYLLLSMALPIFRKIHHWNNHHKTLHSFYKKTC